MKSEIRNKRKVKSETIGLESDHCWSEKETENCFYGRGGGSYWFIDFAVIWNPTKTIDINSKWFFNQFASFNIKYSGKWGTRSMFLSLFLIDSLKLVISCSCLYL